MQHSTLSLTTSLCWRGDSKSLGICECCLMFSGMWVTINLVVIRCLHTHLKVYLLFTWRDVAPLENGVVKSILVVSGDGLPLFLSPEGADEFAFNVWRQTCLEGRSKDGAGKSKDHLLSLCTVATPSTTGRFHSTSHLCAFGADSQEIMDTCLEQKASLQEIGRCKMQSINCKSS